MGESSYTTLINDINQEEVGRSGGARTVPSHLAGRPSPDREHLPAEESQAAAETTTTVGLCLSPTVEYVDGRAAHLWDLLDHNWI
ncbi:hypothetical protein XENOCAPTIV_001518 [Xenoophorus captivus]|uniref:Uncharacterized protein n=1 Tax=Xenoophorus captivus TaxID=1517983 RepID=A0ABV0RK63_9TELE